MKQKIFGKDHQGLADHISNLGVVYFSQGKMEQAEKSYLTSLELKKKTLGNDAENNPLLADQIGNLGNVYYS